MCLTLAARNPVAPLSDRPEPVRCEVLSSEIFQAILSASEGSEPRSRFKRRHRPVREPRLEATQRGHPGHGHVYMSQVVDVNPTGRKRDCTRPLANRKVGVLYRTPGAHKLSIERNRHGDHLPERSIVGENLWIVRSSRLEGARLN